MSSGGKIKEKNRNQNTTTTSADTSAHFHDKDKKSSPTGDASKGSGDHSEDDASRSGLLPSGGPESEVAKKTEVLEHERAGQVRKLLFPFCLQVSRYCSCIYSQLKKVNFCEGLKYNCFICAAI